ncbi:MAG TPA: hypothetical protein VGH28_27615 [Polyangiaceae bacterium]|jgi:hypothetical protein
MTKSLIGMALAACFAAACSNGADEASASATLQSASTDAWQDALPPNASAPTLGDSVRLRGCTYAVGTAVEEPPFPPQYIAFVQRSGNARRCSLGYVVIGSSFATPSVAIAAGEGALVADASSKSTPSGEAHTQLRIVQIDPASGDFVRQTTLAAQSPGPNQPQLGNVTTGSLAIEHGGDLVVQGQKDGIIPGETGSGDNYIATYDGFLHGPESPAPTTVVAF